MEKLYRKIYLPTKKQTTIIVCFLYFFWNSSLFAERKVEHDIWISYTKIIFAHYDGESEILEFWVWYNAIHLFKQYIWKLKNAMRNCYDLGSISSYFVVFVFPFFRHYHPEMIQELQKGEAAYITHVCLFSGISATLFVTCAFTHNIDLIEKDFYQSVCSLGCVWFQ